MTTQKKSSRAKATTKKSTSKAKVEIKIEPVALEPSGRCNLKRDGRGIDGIEFDLYQIFEADIS